MAAATLGIHFQRMRSTGADLLFVARRSCIRARNFSSRMNAIKPHEETYVLSDEESERKLSPGKKALMLSPEQEALMPSTQPMTKVLENCVQL